MMIFTFLLSENNCYSLKIKTIILLWPVLFVFVCVCLLQKTIAIALKLLTMACVDCVCLYMPTFIWTIWANGIIWDKID